MKAVLFQKNDNKIIEVITNVTDYTNHNIYGDSIIEGLSPHVTFKMFEDDAEISIDSVDIKPKEDLRKIKIAQIAELKQKTAELDYIVLQRYREEKLEKQPSKPDAVLLAKLQEQEGYIVKIRLLEQELTSL